MSTVSGKQAQDAVLDEHTLQLLSEAQSEVAPPADVAARMRAHVLDSARRESAQYTTVRAADGPWIEIAPKLEKKVLHVDHETGREAYLLRAQPGAEAPAHTHGQDEVCVVLEGEIRFEDLILRAGDYHLARQGTRHGHAHTTVGALIYLEGQLEA